jgi:transcriptional regulator with XRE-family HTH domain
LVQYTNIVVMQRLYWDKSTMRVNGTQVRMARAGLKMNVRQLAAAAEVSPNTITRVEADLPANTATLGAIRRALEEAGVEFTNHEKPGVRMRPDAPASAPASKLVARKQSKPAAKPARRPKGGKG